MNVLSLFDGMSCGQIALNRAGIPYTNYYASEINKYAIKATQANYPNTIQLGSVVDIKNTSLPPIDILIGGSPCQGFSRAGRFLNFNDPRSKLFFEYVRILKDTKPKYWLLENVVMKKEWEDIISEHLGVSPVLINSNLVSAQNRSRLYWANFPITQPKDTNTILIDILDDKTYCIPCAIRGKKPTAEQKRNGNLKHIQTLELAFNPNKSNCVTTVAKDSLLTLPGVPRTVDAYTKKVPYRYYTIPELCRLQTVPENYFKDVVSNTQAKEMLGNGWTVDVIAHIFRDMINSD